MKNHERPSGKIESTETIWDMTDVEKKYFTKDGESVASKNYSGGGEISYERSSFDSETPLKEMVKPLSDIKIEKENSLISVLSKLYGKRGEKYLSKVLENVESDEFYACPQDEHYDYLDYLKAHSSPNYDSDFYQFAQWYDYALKRYAREKFLPRARQHETEYAEKIRDNITSGLLPESAGTKLAPFDTHAINYSIVDAFNAQDLGGECSVNHKDGPVIKYHIELGLDDEETSPSIYEAGASDFEEVMTHESTHLLFTSLFGVYDNGYGEDWDVTYKKRETLKQTLSEPQLETVEEADRIITEGAVEWMTQILIGSTDESGADTTGGTYHVERRVIDSLLNDGEEKIDAKVLFSLCATAGDELDTNREKFFGVLFRSYPDCRTKLDLAEKIVERFNWFEYQSRQEGN